jgi:hypothetical protein
MKIFISWSGALSGQLGEALRKWLPKVIQSARPYFSPADIEKGARWYADITKELETTSICLIALTRESLRSPWIMFEAGAVSRSVEKTHVCPIVFDLEKTDVQGPLAQYQATKFNRSEMLQLLDTINQAAGEQRLAATDLAEVFDMWWPRLEGEVSGILNSAPPSRPEAGPRQDRELVEETLLRVRNLQDTTERLEQIQAIALDTYRLLTPRPITPAMRRIADAMTAADETIAGTFAKLGRSPQSVVNDSRLMPTSVALEISVNKNPNVIREAVEVARRFGKVRTGREMTDAITISVEPALDEPLELLRALKEIPGVLSAGQA